MLEPIMLTAIDINPATISALLFLVSVTVFVNKKTQKHPKLKRFSKYSGYVFFVLTVAGLVIEFFD